MMKKILEEQSQKVSVAEFASRIRKKYPGSYDDLSDIDLTNKFIKKYPVYSDFVDFGNVTSTVNISSQQPQNQSISANVNTGVVSVSTNFSCIVKNSFWSGRIKTTSDPNHIFYQLPSEQEYNFYANGVFVYRDNPPNRTQTKGTWTCDGESDFIINTEDDARFTSKLGKWENNVSAVPVSDLNNDQKNQTTINSNRRGKYLKIGDKGPKVGELQKLLIDKGFKNISKGGEIDNNFGQRTKQMVMDYQTKNNLKVDGIVGPQTWKSLGGIGELQEQSIKKIVYKNLKSLIQ